jgi:hypothetical protein
MCDAQFLCKRCLDVARQLARLKARLYPTAARQACSSLLVVWLATQIMSQEAVAQSYRQSAYSGPQDQPLTYDRQVLDGCAALVVG